MTPLRAAAVEFVFLAGYPDHPGWKFKLRENRAASRAGTPAYDVLVRAPGARRSTNIGAVLLRFILLETPHGSY